MSQHTLELTDANFSETISSSEVPILVDFWAPWCGPCRIIAPIVEELAANYAGRLAVGKVNTDDNPTVASQYGIRNIPTLLFFKNGTVVNQVIGTESREKLQARVDALLEK